MSNTLVAANVSAQCLRTEKTRECREKGKLEMINLNLPFGDAQSRAMEAGIKLGMERLFVK